MSRKFVLHFTAFRNDNKYFIEKSQSDATVVNLDILSTLNKNLRRQV